MVYAGPRHQVEPVFNLQKLRIPEHFNHADWLLDQVSVDHRIQFEQVSRDKVDRLVAFWKSYERKSQVDTERSSKAGEEQQVKESRLTPMWIAGPVVLERSFRNM